jgi:hypothetical protein
MIRMELTEDSRGIDRMDTAVGGEREETGRRPDRHRVCVLCELAIFSARARVADRYLVGATCRAGGGTRLSAG